MKSFAFLSEFEGSDLLVEGLILNATLPQMLTGLWCWCKISQDDLPILLEIQYNNYMNVNQTDVLLSRQEKTFFLFLYHVRYISH